MSLPPASRAAPAGAARMGRFLVRRLVPLSRIGVIMRRAAHDRQGWGCSTLVARTACTRQIMYAAAPLCREESRHVQAFEDRAFMDARRLRDYLSAGRWSRRRAIAFAGYAGRGARADRHHAGG